MKVCSDWKTLWFTASVAISTSLPAASIWWEAEDPERLQGDAASLVSGPLAPETEEEREWLSGGAWVSHPFEQPAKLTYIIQVPKAGDYRLFARRIYWNGHYKYRIGEGPWVQVADHRIELERRPPKEVKRTDATWATVVETHALKPGPVTIQIESLPNARNGKYPMSAFDAFLLTSEVIVPSRDVPPGTDPASVKVSAKEYGSAQAIASRKLAFQERIRDMLPHFEAGTFRHESGFRMPYQLHVPEGLEPGKRYPLLVCLPSSGGRGNGNRNQLAASEAAWVMIQEDLIKRYPAILLCPQAPDWFSDDPRPKVSKTGVPALTTLHQLVDKVVAEQPVDPDRISIHGQSLGGFGVLHALKADPQRYAAAVVIAGADPKLATPETAKVPTWIFCGTHDNRKWGSQELAKKLEELGGKPKLTLFKGAGHPQGWELAYQLEEFWPWLFAQTRREKP